MGGPEAENFFTSRSLVTDPYPYYDELRQRCPVQREPHHEVMMITGYEEALAVYRDSERFSSCTAVTGPFPGFPVPLDGDDVSDLIERCRDDLPFSDQLPTFDPPRHTLHRGLLMGLLTPRRLKENEDSMRRLAERQLEEVLADGRCEFVRDYAGPFAMLVVADLLGVPEEDHDDFRRSLGQTKGFGSTGGDVLAHTPLDFLYDRFTAYVEDRRSAPRDDVLTKLAQATYRDGTVPDVQGVVRLAANLFAAGQETTVRLLASAVQMIAEDAELQERLRQHRDEIPDFIEETLRFESPVKGDFRLARVPVTVGDVDIPAGTTVMLLNGAANRDPRKFDSPAEFRPHRRNAREHLAFGQGVHFCPGAPLARAEGRITVNQLLDRMRGISVSEEEHGPPGARRFRYFPTYILRGIQRLHIEFGAA
ncbi:cytochrome P450 [Streptomyces sp. MBT62]|uniref:cytochrome P450 n=1 Tax=Streptomyces sp. MBT62 TaxID=2800410 RepID=UPI001F1A7DD4|nr:cytochrome P450 [Streptomyces sp. MBT62]